MNDVIRVIIADDHQIFRNGIKLVLKKFGKIKILVEAENGKELLSLLHQQSYDVVLMDIKMPEMNGIEATRKALEKFPDLNIIILSTFGEENYLEKAIEAGAKGFLLKNVEPEILKLAIETVHAGNNYFSPELMPYFTHKYLSNSEQKSSTSITRREKEVLQMIAKGYTNQEIAEKLFISVRTVDTHKSNLISKTGSKNTVNLLIYAIKQQLVKIQLSD